MEYECNSYRGKRFNRTVGLIEKNLVQFFEYPSPTKKKKNKPNPIIIKGMKKKKKTLHRNSNYGFFIFCYFRSGDRNNVTTVRPLEFPDNLNRNACLREIQKVFN